MAKAQTAKSGFKWYVSWLYVTSGVDSGIVNRLFKFADDTKLVGTVYSAEEIEQFHSDIKRLYDWSTDWQMLFNTDKCKTLILDMQMQELHEYVLGDEVVTTDEKEKDLGVIIHQTLKSNSQCVAAANSANRTLGIINSCE